jgi:formylglycine-generating enzyme required for sulfatase activity
MPQPTLKEFSKIFICYRREDTWIEAGRLFDNLGHHFGQAQLFMDIDNIALGDDFIDVIEDAVADCEILIAVIGPNWLSRAGEESRLLDNPDDFVRLEINAALNRNIRVIPVLVKGAGMPRKQDLPQELVKLARIQALTLSRPEHWRNDVKRLITRIEEVLAERIVVQKEEEPQQQEAEEARIAAAAQAAEETRRQEEARIAAQQAEEARRQEEARIAAQKVEESRRQEEMRIAAQKAEEARRQEEARIAAQKAEEARQKEKTRIAAQKAEEARQKEKARIAAQKAEEARQQEEARIAAQKAEEARQKEEARIAAQKAEEARQQQKARIAARAAEEARQQELASVDLWSLSWSRKRLLTIAGILALAVTTVILIVLTRQSISSPPPISSSPTPTSKQAQSKITWHNTDGIKTFTNGIGVEMIWVPAGNFSMGSNSGNEKHPHQVTISRGFYMGKCEVSQAQWEALGNSNPSNFKGSDLPVEKVSWDDAQNFIKQLNALNDGFTYRLPTEGEWEYAAQWGKPKTAELRKVAWYAENSDNKTHPICQKDPNALGLKDMEGNVGEWCQDWYHDDYTGAPNDGSAWEQKGENPYRVIRGGSYGGERDSVRVTSRTRANPTTRSEFDGFRLVAVQK